MISLAPEVIVANGTPVLTELKQKVSTIPIVFAQVFDPLGAGLVSNLARPEGNIRVLPNFEFSLIGKWLGILKEIAPQVTRVAIIFNPRTAPYARKLLQPAESIALSLRVETSATPVHEAVEAESAITAFARDPTGGLFVLPDAFTSIHRELIISLAAKHRLPVVYPYRSFATVGGLMSYGVDATDLYRRAASYVDLILKGARIGDLPVQQPNWYELVINLKTANALGLTVPPSLLAAPTR